METHLKDKNMYDVGDHVFVVRTRNSKIMVDCPVCYGDKSVIVILGNDEQVKVPCQYCKKGFNDPSGVVNSGYIEISEIVQTTITEVRKRQNYNELEITYSTPAGIYRPEQVSNTRKEAEKLGETRVEKFNKLADEKFAKKYKDHKSYSWNAGYYLNKADQSLKDHERYSKLAEIMNSKSHHRKDKS